MEMWLTSSTHASSHIKNSAHSDSTTDVFADDIELEANSIFHQMFSGQLTIDAMIQMLARFKESYEKSTEGRTNKSELAAKKVVSSKATKMRSIYIPFLELLECGTSIMAMTAYIQISLDESKTQAASLPKEMKISCLLFKDWIMQPNIHFRICEITLE